MLFNKIYIINLLRRQDRKDQLTQRLNALNLSSEIEVIWVEAIDGQGLPEDVMHDPKTQVVPFVDPGSGRSMTFGEVACALSHHKAWSQAYQDLKDGESCLVLEDDVTFTENFNDIVEQLSKQKESLEYDLLYIGSKKVDSNLEEKDYNSLLLEPNYRYWCSSIVYTKEGLKKILDHDYLGRISPADEFIPAVMGFGQKQIIDSLKSKPNVKGLALKTNIAYQEWTNFHNSDTEKSRTFMTSLVNEEEFRVLTVGSDYTDGLKRLEKSLQVYSHSYKILGLGEPWYGGDDILNNPGAGQKVNILRRELKAIVKSGSNPLILFLDGYDTMVLKAAPHIIERYKALGHKILFGAEKTCWPDRSLASAYPASPTPWKYLNSGQFLGYAKDLLDLMEDGIDDADDDQLYYTQKFLEGKHGIGLDYTCDIFQCLASSYDDVVADHGYSELINKFTSTWPSVAHGNGNIDSKYYFNYLSSFLANNFRENYGYLEYNSPDGFDLWNTRVLISVFDTSNNPEHIYNCLDSLRFIEYPKSMLGLAIYTYKNDRRRGIMRYLAQGDFIDYESTMVISNDLKDNDDRWLKTRNLELAKDFNYNFCINSNIYLDKTDILTNLMGYNRSIIAPVIGKNFWLTVNPQGWQHETVEDTKVLNGTYKGVWAAAFINSCYLIDCSIIPTIKEFFKESYNEERGTDMAFCYNLVAKGFVPYVVNLDEGYGEIQ